MTPPRRRLALRLGLGLAVAAVLVATLRPTGPETFQGWTTCLLCANDGLAEAALNVALFMPLGFMLMLAGQRPLAAVLAGLALSLTVECAQIFIPGRDPNVGDLLWNATGAGAGWLAGVIVRALAAPRTLPAARLGAAAAVTIGALVATGWLYQPGPTQAPYRAHRRSADAGAVLSASLGTVSLEPGRLPPGPTADALALGAALRVETVAGPAPSSLYWLRVRDARRHDVIALRKLGDDVVFRYRTRGRALRLAQTDVRARGAMTAVAPGDTVEVIVIRSDQRVCIVVAERPRCGLGPGPGRGWAILRFPEDAPAVLFDALDALWLAALFVPVGLVARRERRHLAPLAAAAAALWIVPAVIGLEYPGAWEALGALAGATVGALVTVLAAAPPPSARARRP